MIKTIRKISFTVLLLLSFTACNDNKKENENKASLPMPSTKGLSSMGLIEFAHNAKKDPTAATKIRYAYSEELKDYKKAFEWFKYSDSMKPMPENSNYACYALQQLKRYKEAIAWCEKAIDLGSDEALFQLGTNFFKMNDYKNSIVWFEKSFEKINNFSAANNLGYIYQEKLKEYNKSKQWYEEAVKGKDLESFHNISRLYHHNLKDDLKASAYSIALINNKFTKKSVLNTLQNTWKIPNETIKKGYELQLTSPEFPIKFKGNLGL